MKKLNFKKLLFPLSFWIFFELVLFIAMIRIEGLNHAIKYSTFVLFPLIIPVHVHEYIFNKFLLKGKYTLYILYTITNVIVFGYILEWFEKLIDPEGNIASHITILIFMFVYIGAKYLIVGTRQQIKLKELEAKQAQAELDLLKSQINPHFLFNSLNSIYSLTLKDSKSASNAVMHLSDLMRYILESSKKKHVPLKEEIEFINNYIELEKIRLGSNFKLNYNITGDAKNLYISPMILIAFVENIFKHGVSLNKEKNEFDIRITIENSQLNFLSINNICIQNNNLETKEEKTGIENVKKRLELLYPDNHKLTFENNNGKFQVNLQIKLNE
ncbi:sensor histidine kinase [Bacteroidota bacterium]